MILLELKAYLQQHKQASLQQLVHQFQQSPDFMRMLLKHWIRKGVVCAAPQPAACGTRCTQCAPAVAEIYLWQETHSRSDIDLACDLV